MLSCEDGHLSTPGVRYERLLFWAAPITLAAFAVFIFTVGYNTYSDRVKANCYDAAAKIVNDDIEEFSKVWAEIKSSGRTDKEVAIKSGDEVIYWSRLRTELIIGLNFRCWQAISGEDRFFERDPNITVRELKRLADELRKQPVKMYGIEMPDVASIGLGGTKIQIAMSNFVQALQVALAPVMLLWLGSLYHTRYREILAFRTHADILSVHPHVINVFPVGYYPTLKKRNWLKSHAPVLWAVWSFLVRVSLLLCFIVPAVAFYIGSLFFQPVFGYWLLNLFAGFLVGIYAFGVLLIEAGAGTKHFEGEVALR